MTKFINHGVIKDTRSSLEQKRDYIAGSSPVPQVVLQENGDWSNFLPDYECQIVGQSFDTMACVTFSMLNCFESLYQRLFGVNVNFSDRFIAKLSGTDKYNGNFAMNVLTAIRTYGLVDERDWPMDNSFIKKDQYYSTIPDPVLTKGKTVLSLYIPNGEVVYPVTKENMLINLKYSPLQVIINNSTHAVTCFGQDVNSGQAKIFDHYKFFGTNIYNYDWSKINYAMRFSLAQIVANFVKTKTSSTVYLKIDGANPVLAPIKNAGTYWELSGRSQSEGWAYSLITPEEVAKYKIIKPISIY